MTGGVRKGMRKAAVLLVLALGAEAGGENLLTNGSFEEGETGWVFFQLGPKDAREIEGKSLHVTKKGDTRDTPTMIWTDYALDPGTEGELSFSIRIKGKKLGRTQVVFIVWDEAGNMSREKVAHDGDVGRRWQTVDAKFEIPGPPKGGRILLRLFEEGELWVDDASVVLKGAAQEEAKGGLSVRNGDFDRSKGGWGGLPGSEDLRVSIDRKELRLSRGGHRLYPEQGVQQIVTLPGKKRKVTLRCTARAEGATACVALLAETAEGALVAYVRAEPSGEAALPLELPSSARRLRIVLAIRGPGDAWFDDVRLEG